MLKLKRPSLIWILVVRYASGFITVPCEEKYDISEWSCSDYEVKLANNKGENLAKTLSCLGYDKFKDPNKALGIEGPTPTYASLTVHKVKSFDIETSELVLEMQESWSWQDPRITWPDECRQGGFLAEIRHLTEDNFKSMWSPTYQWHDVQNVELVTGYKSHEEYIMWKNSTMQWGARYILHQTCRTTFRSFPFDYHDCSVAFNLVDQSKFVTVLWDVHMNETTSLENLQQPDWDVTILASEEMIFTDEDSVPHSGLKFTLRFKRINSKHYLHTFIPSVLLLIVTVFSVLIPVDKSSEKVTISVTTFLSMIALFGSAKDSWPETAYFKAIDIWMVLCYISVFSTLLECCMLIFEDKPRQDTPVKVIKSYSPYTVKNIDKPKCSILGPILKFTKVLIPMYNFAFIAIYFLLYWWVL